MKTEQLSGAAIPPSHKQGAIKMTHKQMKSPRKGTFIPLAIVLLGSACAYMSAGVPNPAPLFLSVFVVIFGVIVGILENRENKDNA